MSKQKPTTLIEMRERLIEFTLPATGEHVHVFRKYTLADSTWVVETFGKPLNQIFKVGNEISFPDLARIWLHQLADPSPFKPELRKVLDYETGKESEVFVSGSRRLMESVDGDQYESVYHAFLLSMGVDPKTEVGEIEVLPAEKKIPKSQKEKSIGP